MDTYSYSTGSNILGNSTPSLSSNIVIRNDLLFYLEQQQGIPNLTPPSNPPRIFPQSLSASSLKYNYDDEDEDETPSCSLYMAESSIPNSGLGIFAGKDFMEDEMVDPSPQVVIPLIDIESNPLYSRSVLSDYPWSAWSQDAQFEGDSVNVLYPNLGMLANSHLGLANVNQNVKDGKTVGIGSPEDRSTDLSTGANTLYHASTFKVSSEKKIRRGEEIFVDYGVNYFHHREEKFQMVFPTAENYKEADKIVKDFAEKLLVDGKEEITAQHEEEWERIILKLEEDPDDKTRVAFALPESVHDVKYVAKIGTARYSIPNSVRALEWLEETGFCLDNLRVGKSMIPYAGNGAFAMKKMKQGSIVAPMPVLPIPRSVLNIHSNKATSSEKTRPSPDKQLLLNYCFGHTNSTLLFFPYSSSVHFVNHNGDDPNAYIRWSDSYLSKVENLNVPPRQVHSGLIMELVALRDIQLGEEVTIDYGIHWSQAWDDHVRHYHDLAVQGNSYQNTNPAVLAQDLNANVLKPIRTIHEQEDKPYPPCIRTACHSQEHNGTYVYTIQDFENLRYCHIHHRVWKGNQYWYDAKMEPSEFHGQSKVDPDGLVTDIPRYAIRFVVGEYCSDLHFPYAFRHEIGVPDDLYPDIWLDGLYKEEGGGMEHKGRAMVSEQRRVFEDDDADDVNYDSDNSEDEVVANAQQEKDPHLEEL